MDTGCVKTMTKWAMLSLLGLGLVGCQTTSTPQPAPPAQMQYNIPSASVSDPGAIQFKISPAGVGGYYGWQMQVTKAASNKGFKPFITDQLSAGQIKEYALWADKYTVNVYRLGDLKYSGWVDVYPGETTVVYADTGLFTDDIAISRQPDPKRIDPTIDTTAWRVPISTTYGPDTLFNENGFRADYTGPQNNGNLVGEGTVEITRNGQPFAEILNAEITDETITGDIEYADGREVDGVYQTNTHQLTPGSTTRWPDGTVFTGTYQAFDPLEGALHMADGNVWQGPVRQRKPAGQGRLTWWEGGWMDFTDASTYPLQTGEFVCGDENVAMGDCYYYGGQKLESAGELAALIEKDRQITAARAAEEAAKAAQQKQTETAQATTPTGCQTVGGKFVADGGDTLLDLDGTGSGPGRFVQYTQGGATRYQFDITLRYHTTADSITYQYGQGTYKIAATGQVLQTMSAPGATVPCRYDGTILSVDGKQFRPR